MAKQGRLAFIDFHRGLVLLVMIEVHVFNAFLSTELKSTEWFSYLNFFNGLVAPSFIYISGFAFILASAKKIDEFRKYGSAFWKQIGRIGLIFLVGYSLRLPFYSLKRSLFESNEKQIASFISVDVLQCIALGLLLLFMLRLIIKKDTVYLTVLWLGAVISVILGPVIELSDPARIMPVWLANFFTQKHGSLFPLFPWLAFMFAGGITGYYFIGYNKEGKGELFIKQLGIMGIVFIIVGHAVIWTRSPLHITMPKPHIFFYIARQGYVFLILWISLILTTKFELSNSPVVSISRESLLIYWLHLQFIYAKVIGGKNPNELINGSFTVWQAILYTLGVTVLMYFAARAWSAVKAKNPTYGMKITFAVLGTVFLIFCIR